MACVHGFAGGFTLDSIHHRSQHYGFFGQGAAVRSAAGSQPNEAVGASQSSCAPKSAGATAALCGRCARGRRQPGFDLDHGCLLDNVLLASGRSRHRHDLRPSALAATPDDLLRRLDCYAHFCLANTCQGYLKVTRLSRLTQHANSHDCDRVTAVPIPRRPLDERELTLHIPKYCETYRANTVGRDRNGGGATKRVLSDLSL